jgi:very-short-patch-repair endonuclease
VWDGREWPRYYLDLADPRRRVAAEYDGSSHLDRARLRADRERHNYLDSAGWRMRYFTDRDIYRPPSYVVRVVEAALRGR